MNKQFVHLHAHSHYSLLDGLPKIDELVNHAKEQNAPALALTDHGTMYGVIEFYQKAKAAGVKPIIGVEAYVAPLGHTNKRAKIDEKNNHLVLLAKNNTGYRNLIKLITIAHLEGYYYRPRIDHELLEKYHQGIIVLSACLKGELAQAILSRDDRTTEQVISFYKKTFGQDYYLELQPHDTPEQKTVNTAIKALAKKHHLPLVATGDVHYLTKEDKEAQDILLCIHLKKQLNDKDRMSMAAIDASFQSAEDMAKHFADVPEALANTVAIAEQCNVDIALGQVQLPHYQVAAGKTYDQVLRELCEQGIPRRYGQETLAVRERLDYELGVIETTGFSPYFLIVQDLVNWAKDQGIVVGPGRGSAAGSIVSYLCNITNVDPLRYELLFERFLNPERISMPDIDMDFADIRRDEVIRYVEKKYGQDHVAQIITFGTMAARAAIRDVGRVLGLPYSYCDRVAKLIPFFTDLAKAIATVPELKEIYDNDPDGKRLLSSAMKLEGVARHSSRHACGVVITKDPLDQSVPLQYASPDDRSIITQFSLHPIEDLGLLKMDFLGLSNLTILETCINIVKQTQNIDIELDTIPLDDKKTFQLLKRAETTGVFQLESGGMRRYLKELKPTNLEDIISMVALYRPGPMEFIPQFIAGKHGKYKPVYLDRRLEPILNMTYGVAVYQEQVMRMARDLAGFTLGEADVLRKAVGKKIAKLLKEQRDKFVTGCVKNGITKSTGEKIFDFIEPFARYGFPRAHAACYAVIAYQTAYCKANYPAEFMAALLTSDEHNTDRVALEIDEARRMGLHVLPPDVNESYASFTVVHDLQNRPNTIRFGLRAIKNVGDHLVEAMIAERKKNGPFSGLEDFLRRVQHKDLNKKSLESLAKVGALDAVAERQAIVDNINDLLKYAKRADEESVLRQTSIFGYLPTTNAPQLRLRQVTPAPSSQRGQWEKEMIGLYITDHPLREYRDMLAKIAQPIATLREPGPKQIKLGGCITTIKRIMTKTNDRMAFVRVEDMTGSIEVVVFPNLFRETADLWQEDQLVMIEGQRSNKDGEWKILADRIRRLPPLVNNAGQSSTASSMPPVQISLQLESTSSDILRELTEMLKGSPGERQVELVVRRGQDQKKIPTDHRVTLTPELRTALQQRFGDCIVEV